MKNDDPGAWDLLVVGVSPELSVALGSVQKAVAKLLPTGAVTRIALLGQPVMTGGVVSPPDSESKQLQNGVKVN